MVAVMVVFCLGSVICALAESFGLLIVGRLLQGVGAGAIPLAFGIIKDNFPPDRIPGSVGFVASLVGIGAGAGVLLSGPIIDLLSISWLFWGPACVAAIDALVLILLVPETPSRSSGGVNWLGAALLAGGLGAVLLALAELGASGVDSATGWLFAVSSVCLLVLWFYSERRSPHPLVNLTTMRRPGIWTANAAGFLVGLGTYVGFIEIPKFAQTPVSTEYGFGASVTESGLYLLPWTLLILVAGQFTGVLDRRFGARMPLLAGTALSSISFVMLFFLHGSSVDFFLASTVMGVGIGLALGALSNLTIESAPVGEVGVATAINLVVRLMGGALGAQAAGALLDSEMSAGYPTEHGYALTFGFTAVALGAAFTIGLLAPRKSSPLVL
jgi:MFS family permease